MPEMKTLNGYEIVDAKAREDIAALQAGGENVQCPTYFFNPTELVFDQGVNNALALAPDNIVEFANKFVAGEDVHLLIYYTPRWLPAEVAFKYEDKSAIIVYRTVSLGDIGNDSVFNQWELMLSNGVWYVQKYDDEIIHIVEKSELGGGGSSEAKTITAEFGQIPIINTYSFFVNITGLEAGTYTLTGETTANFIQFGEDRYAWAAISLNLGDTITISNTGLAVVTRYSTDGYDICTINISGTDYQEITQPHLRVNSQGVWSNGVLVGSGGSSEGGSSSAESIPYIPFYKPNIDEMSGLYAIDSSKNTLQGFTSSNHEMDISFQWWVSNGVMMVRDGNVVAWGQDNADIMFYVVSWADYEYQTVTISPTATMKRQGWMYDAEQSLNEKIAALEARIAALEG